MKNEAFSGKEIFHNILFLSDKIALLDRVFAASIFHIKSMMKLLFIIGTVPMGPKQKRFSLKL